MSKLILSNREEFLWTMYYYLKSGNNGYMSDIETYIHDESIKGRQELTHEQVMDILNDKEKLLQVDVIHDELDYFGLTIDDFIWESEENKESKYNVFKTTDYFKEDIEELLTSNENGYTKEECLIFDSGLKTTFFDDYEEFLREEKEFIEWANAQCMDIRIVLKTINERIAVVIY